MMSHLPTSLLVPGGSALRTSCFMSENVRIQLAMIAADVRNKAAPERDYTLPRRINKHSCA